MLTKVVKIAAKGVHFGVTDKGGNLFDIILENCSNKL